MTHRTKRSRNNSQFLESDSGPGFSERELSPPVEETAVTADNIGWGGRRAGGGWAAQRGRLAQHWGAGRGEEMGEKGLKCRVARDNQTCAIVNVGML